MSSISDLVDGAEEKQTKKVVKVKEVKEQKEEKSKVEKQKPSVGRIVHFVKNGGDEFEIIPAIIMAVKPTGAVNLNVFEPGYVLFMRDVPESLTPQAGFWHWPKKE